MEFTPENLRKMAIAVCIITTLMLFGMTSAVGLGFNTSIWGALTIGALLGIGQLGIAYGLYKNKF